MTEHKLLEKLKDKSRVQVWALCTDQEKDLCRKACSQGKLRYLSLDGWMAMNMGEIKNPPHFATYKINADFTLDPPYIDVPIEVYAKRLGAHLNNVPGRSGWYTLANLISLPEFDGFYNDTTCLAPGCVPPCYRKGQSVIVHLLLEDKK